MMNTKIQDMRGGKSRRTKKRVRFLPFRGLVKCGVCGHMMTPAVSGGHGGKYLYYRCDNENCPRKPRSVRANVVLTPYLRLLESLILLKKTIRYTATG